MMNPFLISLWTFCPVMSGRSGAGYWGMSEAMFARLDPKKRASVLVFGRQAADPSKCALQHIAERRQNSNIGNRRIHPIHRPPLPVPRMAMIGCKFRMSHSTFVGRAWGRTGSGLGKDPSATKRWPVLTTIGVGDFSNLVRVQPNATFAALEHRGRKPLQTTAKQAPEPIP